MSWDETLFGARAEHVRLAEAEQRAVETAKDVLQSRIHLATVDHNGKRLNERRWRWFANMVESL